MFVYMCKEYEEEMQKYVEYPILYLGWLKPLSEPASSVFGSDILSAVYLSCKSLTYIHHISTDSKCVRRTAKEEVPYL